MEETRSSIFGLAMMSYKRSQETHGIKKHHLGNCDDCTICCLSLRRELLAPLEFQSPALRNDVSSETEEDHQVEEEAEEGGDKHLVSS